MLLDGWLHLTTQVIQVEEHDVIQAINRL